MLPHRRPRRRPSDFRRDRLQDRTGTVEHTLEPHDPARPQAPPSLVGHSTFRARALKPKAARGRARPTPQPPFGPRTASGRSAEEASNKICSAGQVGCTTTLLEHTRRIAPPRITHHSAQENFPLRYPALNRAEIVRNRGICYDATAAFAAGRGTAGTTAGLFGRATAGDVSAWLSRI
jgi:hypothetical protein